VIIWPRRCDGWHIRTLLLTFFFRQMKPLVEGGSCTWPTALTRPSSARRRLPQDDVVGAFMAEHPDTKQDFQRLKGPGRNGLRRVARHDHGRRTPVPLQINVEQAAMGRQRVLVLMGDDVEQRRHFIQTNAKDVASSHLRRLGGKHTR